MKFVNMTTYQNNFFHDFLLKIFLLSVLSFIHSEIIVLITCMALSRTETIYKINTKITQMSRSNIGVCDYGCRFTIYSLFMDIQNSFLDIQKSINGYPKIHFWISKNQLNIEYP